MEIPVIAVGAKGPGKLRHVERINTMAPHPHGLLVVEFAWAEISFERSSVFLISRPRVFVLVALAPAHHTPPSAMMLSVGGDKIVSINRASTASAWLFSSRNSNRS